MTLLSEAAEMIKTVHASGRCSCEVREATWELAKRLIARLEAARQRSNHIDELCRLGPVHWPGKLQTIADRLEFLEAEINHARGKS